MNILITLRLTNNKFLCYCGNLSATSISKINKFNANNLNTRSNNNSSAKKLEGYAQENNVFEIEL